MDLKNNKGSITVFVVASCMLFIIVALGISNFIQNKSNNEEEQFREIKKSYEKDIGNEDEIYNRLKDNSYSEDIDFETKQHYVIPTDESSITISQKVTIMNNNLNINSISYRWYYKENESDANWQNLGSGWTPLAKLDKTYNVKKDNAEEGIYALKIKINEETYNDDCSSKIIVEENSITIDSSLTSITFGNELGYNYKVGTGTTAELAKTNSSTVTVTNNTYNYSTMTTSNYIYAEATDSYGNKVYISQNLAE